MEENGPDNTNYEDDLPEKQDNILPEETPETLVEAPETAPTTPVKSSNTEDKINEIERTATIENQPKKITVKEWLVAMNWLFNPFTFSIIPELFVGYNVQAERLMMALEEQHKFVFLAGPTGSGKTTMLKWIASRLPAEYDVIYLAKPPEKPDYFMDIFNLRYKKSRFAFWQTKIHSLYEIPSFLNRKLANRHLILFFDEVHESNIDVLEWLRVLADQVDNMFVILSGLPVFENHLKDKLETFRKRIAAKIELVSLTREETEMLIKQRILHAGGNGNEFSPELIDYIYAQSGGFPREVLRFCDELVNQAILSGRKEFVRAAVQEEVVTKMSLNIVDQMTPMQREIIEMLAKNAMTPGEIANAIDLQKYKSRQHAVRSINNIMKKLYEDGYLERRRSDKAFVYSLSGKLRTIVVKA